MNDLGGPEKPFDWGVLLKQEMSKPTAARPLYTPERVRPRHRIAVMLSEAGWKSQDIARALRYTESRLSVILNSHHPGLQQIRAKFASQVADNVLDVQSRMKMYANEMLDVLVGHARRFTEKPELSRLAARDILHMAGYTPVKKIFQANTNVPVEDLKRLVEHIEGANEVVLRSDQWSVKDPVA